MRASCLFGRHEPSVPPVSITFYPRPIVTESTFTAKSDPISIESYKFLVSKVLRLAAFVHRRKLPRSCASSTGRCNTIYYKSFL